MENERKEKKEKKGNALKEDIFQVRLIAYCAESGLLFNFICSKIYIRVCGVLNPRRQRREEWACLF